MNAEEKLKELSKLVDDNKTFFIETFCEPILRDGYYFSSSGGRDLFICSKCHYNKYVSQILFFKGSTLAYAVEAEPFAKAYADQFNEKINLILSFGDTLLESLEGLETRINFILDIEKNRLFL